MRWYQWVHIPKLLPGFKKDWLITSFLQKTKNSQKYAKDSVLFLLAFIPQAFCFSVNTGKENENRRHMQDTTTSKAFSKFGTYMIYKQVYAQM